MTPQCKACGHVLDDRSISAGEHSLCNDSEIKAYLSAIGRKGGQKSRRKLTKSQARAMVRARTAKRARLRPNDKLRHSAPAETEGMKP